MLARVIRSPLFAFNVLVGTLLLFFFLAWVSVGNWCEGGLRVLGYRGHPYWLPAVLGIVVYLGLGIIGPACLGGYLISWPGVLIGPLGVLALIIVVDRW